MLCLSPAYPAAALPCGVARLFWSPAAPAFSLIFCPHPPIPLPLREGDFDNTFDEVTQAALLGSGVILISVTIVCVTGGAPVTALVACTANSAPAITANQAHLALLAASSAVAIFDGGDVGDAAKDIAFDTGSDFVMQAIGGNAAA